MEEQREEIDRILRSMILREDEYNFQIDENDIITLNIASENRHHVDVIENIISYLYLQQMSASEGNLESSANLATFTVTPINNTNIPVLHYSLNHNSLQQNSSTLRQEHLHLLQFIDNDSEEEEEKPDYFANCKLINKYVGKPEKIKKNDPSLEEECFICFEKYKVGELKRTLPMCKHSFHKKCVDKWLKNKSTCPHCRCDLMKDVEIEEEDSKKYYEDGSDFETNYSILPQGLIEIEFHICEEEKEEDQREEEKK